MADFTRMSGYRNDCNFTQVKFGADAPLLEVELNELQQIQNYNRAELVRQSIPSGFITLSSLDFDYMKTHPNTLKTKTESILNVNGYLVKIPAETEIKLAECTAVGRQSDLVMLECWTEEIGYSDKINKYGKDGETGVDNYIQDSRVGLETTRRAQLKYRLRVVDKVNFDVVSEGVEGVKAIGASNVETTLGFKLSPTDRGLYVAGDGEISSKSLLRTIDGYCYAIPMYHITRRNTGEYSDKNGNGGSKYENEKSQPTRPDNLFSNIVYERDIVDLRHSVSPTGFNFQKLLSENFDKFMRGELQTVNRLATDKIYMGVLKTPMDEFIQFSATLDGKTIAETGGEPTESKKTKYIFLPSPTGLGIVGTNYDSTDEDLILNWTKPFTMKDYITMDFFIQKNYSAETDRKDISLIKLLDSSNNRAFIDLSVHENALKLKCNNTSSTLVDVEVIPALKLDNKRPNHVRVLYDYVTKALRFYLNGEFIEQKDSIDLELKEVSSYSVKLGGYGYILSDFSLSSVARNGEFKTLPKDFVEGYDSIAPSFNGQRKIYSEALAFQNVSGLVKASGVGHSLGLTATQATAGKWASGDTISIRGLANEILTGVVDEEMILARLTSRVNNASVIKVDYADKLDKDDEIKLYNTANGTMLDGDFTVSEVDKVNKIVTLDSNVDIGSDYMYYVVVDVSAEASSPVIKYTTSKGDIVMTKGVWKGVGTPKIDFILGENTDLTGDIQIDYGMLIPAGQGTSNDVLTKVLGGEIRGRKLKVGKIAVMDDLSGKVRTQINENPNSMYTCSGSELKDIKDVGWKEDEQSGYNSVMSLKDSNERLVNAGANGEMAQVKFTFNILAMIEAKFGELKVIDKVDWLKNNVDKVHITWTGKAVGATSNTAHFTVRDIEGNKWDDKLAQSHKESNMQPLTLDLLDQKLYIDKDGCITVLAYSEKSDENTTASLTTDYIKCELELDYKGGYDILVPENPRRDAGQCGIIQVRRSTKEVITYFNSTKEDCLVIYGEYIPVYPIVDKEIEFTILEEGDGFLISDLSTSVGYKQGIHHYMNPLHRVRNDIVDLFGEFGFGNVPFASDSRGVNIGAKVKFNSYGAVDNFTRQYGLPSIDKPMVGIARYLVFHEGEIKMLVFSKYTNSGALNIDNLGICMLVPLENRPLVKEVEGIKRVNTTPTPWKTPVGAVEGYLNEDGQLVVTYQ